MSYISAWRNWTNDEVLVWERTSAGRTCRRYRAPFYYYEEDNSGNHLSIYGKKLRKITCRTSRELNHTRKNNFTKQLYEADIPPEIKVLSDNYYKKPLPELHITFIDIEVDYDPDYGFPDATDSYAPISAISVHHYWSGQSTVFAVPPPGWDPATFDKSLTELSKVVLCENEDELLASFLLEIEDSDVLCGWNSDVFDIPYIANRVIKRSSVLGDNAVCKLNFDEVPQSAPPRFREFEKRFPGSMNVVKSLTVDLQGRERLDYLELFQKYEMDKRPSYRLEAIAEEVLPNLPKLSYEGSLHNLYHNNFNFFIRYNIRDCEILKGFEDKLGYVRLANIMIHISGALFRHVLGTISLHDYALYNYCRHELKVVVPDHVYGYGGAEPETAFKGIEGALVLEPRIGLHDKVGSIDLRSLYPNVIRSLNISPERIVGQLAGNAFDWIKIRDNREDSVSLQFDDERETLTMPAKEIKKYLREHKWAVSAHGTVFDQSKPGVIPIVIADWFNQRKQYQALKKQAEAAKDEEKALYYDRLQYVYKIKLNSLYGALTNQFFRFFDPRMGESVTATGRAILTHQISKAGEILDGEYSITAPSVIYGDTDSCYFATGAETHLDAVKIADLVAKKVNQSYKKYMQDSFLCNEGYDDKIEANREIVTGRGLFVEKKRYVLHVKDIEGKPTDKLKIMGLDLKKTIIPKHVSIVLLKFVESLLRGTEWETLRPEIVEYKKKLSQSKNIVDIGLPKGINKVENYQEAFINNVSSRVGAPATEMPGHVAAAVLWNLLREQNKDNESPKILTGSKVKVFYLRTKVPYTNVAGLTKEFKSIALPGDITVIPKWFLDKFAVDIDIEAHLERLIDNPLNNILKAIGKEVPSEYDLHVESLFEF